MKPIEMVQLALDAAAAFKTVQQVLKQKTTEPSEDGADGVVKNSEGTVTIRRSFRLDPQLVAENSHPNAKKTAGAGVQGVAHDGGPGTAQDEAVACCDGKGHDTPIENCKAKNPLFCPYHGIPAMKQNFLACLQHYGLATADGSVPFEITKKPSGAFQIAVTCKDMSAQAAENAIKQFLGQAGFKSVDGSSEGLNAAGKFEVSQAFKQDMAQAPDDLSMLQEWQEALLDDEAMIGSDKHLELLSMLAELDGADPSNLTDGQKSLLAQAQEAYHQLKAESDFKDVASDTEAYAKAAELTQACDELVAAANKTYAEVKASKKDAGFDKSPKGFPGNTEYNAAYTKVCGTPHCDKAHFDAGKVELANAALVDALTAGDMEKAKKALYDLAYAKEQMEKHAAVFGQHADTMKKNFKLFKDSIIDANYVTHNSLQQNKVIFADLGIAYPEELQKTVFDAVAAQQEQHEQKAQEIATEVVAKASKAKPKAAGGKKTAKSGDVEAEIATVQSASDEILKPLAHDESAFPADVTQKMLETALKSGEVFGNSGSGLAPTKVTIGGKSYVLKKADDKSDAGRAIRNGHAADMAYRAGGIHAPDSKLYTFGGQVYKLSEFVSGTRLDKIMAGNDEQAKEAARKSLLKGFPLDALFSNWDVLGTNPSKGKHFSNVIIDKKGNAYRIDNDGAFDATGLVGGKKNCHNGNFLMPVAFEDWEEKGGWKNREWIDDFRTMRMEKMNQGVFDGYSTADIFIAAGNINLAAACATLPSNLKAALKKPLHEMNQMARRAVSLHTLGGYQNNEMLSQALDASYEASKLGLRKMCEHTVHYNNGGFGENQKSAYMAKEFPKPEPEEPQDPVKAQKGGFLPNESYTGSYISNILVNAAKTINHHAGFQMKDAQGNVLGNGSAMPEPDYHPNAEKMAEFGKISREKLEVLAKDDANAKTLLSVYDAIITSKNNGFKTAIGAVPSLSIAATIPVGFKTKEEMAFEKDKKGVIEKFKADHADWETAHAKWAQEKSNWDSTEKNKALASGKSFWKNFHAFANDLMSNGIDTHGIKHPNNGTNIEQLEEQACAQKGSSGSACKMKLWEMALMGMSLDDIAKLDNNHPLIHKSTWGSGIDSAVAHYQAHPAEWKKDLRSYAVYKGLNLTKMENETNSLFDHDSGTVGVFRGLGGMVKDTQGVKKNIVKGENAIHQEGTSDCCMFEKNSWTHDGQQAYIIPMSRVCFNFHNNGVDGSHIGCYASEQEIICNLTGMVPYGVASGAYQPAYKEAKTGKKISALMKKWADRIAPFAS